MSWSNGKWCATALCAVVLALASSASAAGRQAAKGRIDVIAVDNKFELLKPKHSPRATLTRCTWLGADKARTGVSCEKRLGKKWEEIWVEFTPAADGKVSVNFQGEWYKKMGDADVRLVWVDNISIEGAKLRNGDLEERADNGWPVGWWLSGNAKLPAERYSRDGSVARSGKSCVAAWYGAQLQQEITVTKGKVYRVRAWFRVIDPARVDGSHRVRFEFPAETYEQELALTFKTDGAARKARLAMTELYNDYTWAISSRWDDNNKSDLKMRDVLARHGHKGTWYLNWGGGFAPTARKLLAGGNSIGGHGLSHPMLTYLNRNRIFEAVAGVRAEWEAAADTQINSYAFSFCNFRNELEGAPIQIDITRALERAGYYNIANGWYHKEDVETDMILSPIMPWDGKEIDGFAADALASESFRRRHPNLSFAMHVWYKGPKAWAKFEAQLDKYGRRPNWWYCNQNQYAAYRYQFLRTKIGKPKRTGRTVTFTLTRPLAADLNDLTPLTLRIAGVEADEVESVTSPTADCTPSSRKGKGYLFHLSHNRDQQLPTKIGIIHNRDNRATLTAKDVDPDFPDLQALLHFRDGKLQLTLSNRTLNALPIGVVKNVRVTYRLPLAWKEGVVRRRLENIDADIVTDTLTPTPATDDYKLTAGIYFFAAQVDFVHLGKPGRLHLTCRARAGAKRDPSYPQGGFTRLGPIRKDWFDMDEWAGKVRAGGPTVEPLKLPDGKQLTWVVDDSPAQKPYLTPETIRTTGGWHYTKQRYWVLQSNVHSPRERAVGLRYAVGSIPAIFVNGKRVSNGRTTLRAGANRMVLIYRSMGTRYRTEHAGAFLRLVKPGTSQRVKDVRFEPVAAPGKDKG